MFKALAERINNPALKLPQLLITEVRPDAESTAYIELTNFGDTTINLAPFTIHSVYGNTRCVLYTDTAITFNRSNAAVEANIGKIYLKGTIKPGESMVFSTVRDANNSRFSGIPTHNTAIAQIGKQFVHKTETGNKYGWIYKPEWQCFGKDSVDIPFQELKAEISAGYLLHWKFRNSNGILDSTYIDQFNHFYYPNSLAMKNYDVFPIAGVVNAMTSNIMVRKAKITKGNLNWNQSRGVDAQTSEWIVIPKNTSNNMAFTTAGTHGNFSLDYSAKNPSDVNIDITQSTISIPWGIVRGDSLARHLNLGKGMGWSYGQNSVFADSVSYIARTGDKFTLYAAGDSLQKVNYTLQVRQPDPNMALVFPKRKLQSQLRLVANPETGLKDTTYRYSWSSFAYGLSTETVTDSIINVPFATRNDSLFKYLEKPEKAKWEIVYVDGQNRVDLKFGDKLKVTSENGLNVKEYFIAVSNYIKGNNALLRTVTWPDIDKIKYPRWNEGDTLSGFNSLKLLYDIELNYDEKRIPAFQFIAQDTKSKIAVVNAINLNGTPEQRTTTVTITSESDTLSTVYKFVFRKQGVPVQPNTAEPFFSEMIKATDTQGHAIEIYNPGSEELDLSRYCILRGIAGQTWQDAVKTLVDATTDATFKDIAGVKIYQTHYFPTRRWTADKDVATWNAVPTPENPRLGKGFIKSDEIYNPWVKPGDVWVCGTVRDPAYVPNKTSHILIYNEADFLFKGTGTRKYPWPSYPISNQFNPAWTKNYQYLLKVINDSILDGTKDVRDPSAYELIDRFEAKGDSIAGVLISTNQTFVRKPTVSKGTQAAFGGKNETAASSEWIVYPYGVKYLGHHTMIQLTNYKSTITSIKLIVSQGYSGDDLSIKGSIATYSPTTIAQVIDKADSTQVFVFKRGSTVLTADESLAENDVLQVTSGDGRSTTVYKLINYPLDNNTSLTAKAGSGLTVSNQKVTGVTVGMKLKDALANLEVAEKSLLYVINANGALQPLKVNNLDTLQLDVLVSENFVLEVIAENSNKESYSFDFAVANNQAILMSNILEIDQSKKLIVNLPKGQTVTRLLSLLFANKGATIKILDKVGFERSFGTLNIDDIVEVTAPDGVSKVNYKVSEFILSSVFELKNKSAFDIEFFPNPVSSILRFAGAELEQVKVYSLTGILMISERNLYGNNLDVSYLQNGIYLLEMTNKEGKVVVDKFLKR